MQYLAVPNWDKYQHYRDRSPKWIKLHQTVLDSYEFGCLTDVQKAHVMLIWLLASKLENRIPHDPAWISTRIGASDTVDVDALIQAGFLAVEHSASDSVQNATNTALTPLAQRESRERVERETDQIAPRRKPDAEPASDEAALLTYPTNGKPREWALTQAHVDDWETLYPSLDILAECRKALAWVRANPSKRKTAGGMPRTLVSWFNRANDRPSANGRASPPAAGAGRTRGVVQALRAGPGSWRSRLWLRQVQVPAGHRGAEALRRTAQLPIRRKIGEYTYTVRIQDTPGSSLR